MYPGAMRSAARWKGLAGRLALLLASLALSLGAAEAGFRVLDVMPTHRDSLRGFYDHHPSLGWIGVPGYTARFRHDDFDVVIENDERGFRRAAVPFDGPDAAPRWAFLGDSFTWGWGVAQGEVFTDRLQQRLGSRARILNYGVTAYGTGQERLLLEDVVLRDHPDEVVVMFFDNDPMDSVYPKKGRRPYYALEDGRLRLHNRPVARPLVGPVDRLAQHSVVLSLVRQQLKRLEDRFEVEGRQATAPEDWEVVAALLAEMQEVAAAARPPARLRVVYVPKSCDVLAAAGAPTPTAGICAGPPAESRARLAAICAGRGIPLLDLSEAFAAAWRARRDAGTSGEPYYFAHDGHWTALGHELAAERILAAWGPGGAPQKSRKESARRSSAATFSSATHREWGMARPSLRSASASRSAPGDP
jgi:lysophospholipase L1-like esterase